MSSVISASRLCEGNMLESSEAYSGPEEDMENELFAGESGLTSARTAEGDSELSMQGAIPGATFLGALGPSEVARDMSSTSRGRMCFPSEFV